jgi:hypothetical protein
LSARESSRCRRARCDTPCMRYPSHSDPPGPSGWADLPDRLRAVQAARSDAQHDLDTILRRPTLFDGSDPVTAEFLRALRACDQLPREGVALVPSWAAQSAVDELERAWRQAQREADRVGLSRLRPVERRRVRRARRLLHKAWSDRGSIQLREGYFHRAENLLSGLIALPIALRAEILEIVRRPSQIQGTIGEGGGTWV